MINTIILIIAVKDIRAKAGVMWLTVAEMQSFLYSWLKILLLFSRFKSALKSHHLKCIGNVFFLIGNVNE